MRAILGEPKEYFTFGRLLHSVLEFPDLSPASSADLPRIELTVDFSSPPEPIELKGVREIGPDWVFRLFRVPGGLRLDYGSAGSYGVFSAGRRIVWYPGSHENVDALLEMARAIVLGPVMALALGESGILCLHGSAVAIGGQATAFLAPKHHGKSTLALALTAAGCRLLTDDLVAIEHSGNPAVLPGVHSVRLLDDIVERMTPRFPEARLKDGFKSTLSRLGSTQLAWESTPLAAIYLIRPVTELAGGLVVGRTPEPRVQAAAALALLKKVVDELVGYVDAGSALEWIAHVASAVPVYRLRFLADLDRLPEVVREIMAWHGEIANAGAQE